MNEGLLEVPSGQLALFFSLDYGGRSARILAGSGGSNRMPEKITA
jgi:hypothetical protein